MVTKDTWPNFRRGNERQGCQVILREHDYEDDVQYGNTKIFVKSPQTVFALENARSEMIPGITMFLQKVRQISPTSLTANLTPLLFVLNYL